MDIPEDIVGAFEAKTHLSELLEKVANGASVVITKRGRALARLVPYREQQVRTGRRAAIEGLTAIRKKVAGTVDARSFVSEGRKR